MTEPLYPLRFKEILRNYHFGDRWIAEAYEKTGLPEDHRIAETWEVCDRPPESSEVINGPLAGQTLHTLIDDYGVALLGRDVVERSGRRFPLLIKFLDASNPLLEQAHHNDALAERKGLDDPGKTEAWYMLKTREGATVRVGNRSGVTPDAVRDALLEGTVKELMRPYEVAPGDAFLLYAGTMHYSAGGVLFYEIMQNSDVYISLRAPDPELSQDEREARAREALEGLHIEEGFDAKTEPVVQSAGANTRTFVLACRYFALERYDLNAPTMINCKGERFYVLSQVEGSSIVVHGEHRELLKPGQTVLLPASLGLVTLVPSEPSVLLKTYVPNLMTDIVMPLRVSGVSDEAIAGLGGRTTLNDLAPMVRWNGG
ncbi:MAG: type I phosphomannose isomerase catalytic subunit [Anaerolineae bacterium]